MTIHEIEAKSILRKHKRIDSWFVSRYSMNLYRGCLHNCVYCDGRTEKYQVKGEFGKDITVKVNAIEILKRELDPFRRRVPLIPGFMMLGGGVGDCYQQIENKYHLAQRALQLLNNYQWPVHILTKSTTVLNDIDIINKINTAQKAIISFSFSSTNDKISSIFEPGVPPPSERLVAIKQLVSKNIVCGMFLMPIIPFVTDSEEYLDKSIKDAKNAGVSFIIFSGMTIKQGRQKQYFLKILKQHFPALIPEYMHIYHNNKWGQTTPEYNHALNQSIIRLACKYRIPLRIPASLFSDIIPENDRVVVILDQIEYLLKLRGQRSSFGYAATQLSKIRKPLSQIPVDLRQIQGIGPKTVQLVNEIEQTGTSRYYEKLLNFK